MNKNKLPESPNPSLSTSYTSLNEGFIHVSHMSQPLTPAPHVPALLTPLGLHGASEKSHMTNREHSRSGGNHSHCPAHFNLLLLCVCGGGGLLFAATADRIEDGKQEMSARSPRKLPSSPPCSNKHELVLEYS